MVTLTSIQCSRSAVVQLKRGRIKVHASKFTLSEPVNLTAVGHPLHSIPCFHQIPCGMRGVRCRQVERLWNVWMRRYLARLQEERWQAPGAAEKRSKLMQSCNAR